ncbi:hypothetical protein HELRODRAFT_113173 [Helobdella robusta]|uniref:Coatomer subunit zeta n=1 Tax=Helobdella robusta TaxID=6412 RepID=T1EFQ6_HELRO|nr:hypothetical protein HELRODRAFT_113173 [Helobdella robusta]ESO00642.1 hypothetical protein HELRODRAFT_113173 [Helobdella robusta]
MEPGLLDPSMYLVKGILIMDNDGNRLFARYYDSLFPTVKEQKVFEKSLFSKTHKTNAEILMLEGLICIYRSSVDLLFYVIGSAQENELILVSVLNCIHESISTLLRKNVEKRALLDNMDGVFLAIDEICDSGLILECDPAIVSQRACFRMDDLPLGEQTIASVIQSAKDQIKWPLLK